MTGPRCASFDGDADRIVFFQNKDLGLELFDGDRIAVLFATLIQKLIAELPDAKRPTVSSRLALSLSLSLSSGC